MRKTGNVTHEVGSFYNLPTDVEESQTNIVADEYITALYQVQTDDWKWKNYGTLATSGVDRYFTHVNLYNGPSLELSNLVHTARLPYFVDNQGDGWDSVDIDIHA